MYVFTVDIENERTNKYHNSKRYDNPVNHYKDKDATLEIRDGTQHSMDSTKVMVVKKQVIKLYWIHSITSKHRHTLDNTI